ncbi:MAG TPA: flagellar motor switch protein FliM, partial [Methylophaga sp.]|nr:flagellar motor switch protein FliM [Methylophaga sp.]
VEDIPMFRSTFGEHKDKSALKIVDIIEHPRDKTSVLNLVKGR